MNNEDQNILNNILNNIDKNKKLKGIKVINLKNDVIYFDDGTELYSEHESDCCETHKLVLDDLTLDDFEGLEFNIEDDNFFTRIKDYGIALNPIIGFPIRIPGYAFNNGWYSSNLALVVRNIITGYYKSYDITECQDY